MLAAVLLFERLVRTWMSKCYDPNTASSWNSVTCSDVGKRARQNREKIVRSTGRRVPDQISSSISAMLVHLLRRSKPVAVTLTLLLVPVAFPQSTTRQPTHSAEPRLHQAARPGETRSRMTHR